QGYRPMPHEIAPMSARLQMRTTRFAISESPPPPRLGCSVRISGIAWRSARRRRDLVGGDGRVRREVGPYR
ncbi:MAG TPA: hypothetical protein VIH08_06230, partial [Blastococcus sp.]